MRGSGVGPGADELELPVTEAAELAPTDDAELFCVDDVELLPVDAVELAAAREDDVATADEDDEAPGDADVLLPVAAEDPDGGGTEEVLREDDCVDAFPPEEPDAAKPELPVLPPSSEVLEDCVQAQTPTTHNAVHCLPRMFSLAVCRFTRAYHL
jgi:hypothetical protein